MKQIAAVFWQFLLLGCVSFGGPAAHIGYFKRTFVDKKAWLGDDEYARLIALSQFLPGPGSSQVGFAIGMKRPVSLADSRPLLVLLYLHFSFYMACLLPH